MQRSTFDLNLRSEWRWTKSWPIWMGAVGLCGLSIQPAQAQMVAGADMPGFAKELGLNPAAKNLEIRQIGTSLGANVLWPKEQGTFEFLITNKSGQARQLDGFVHVVGYRTQVAPGDIWVPHVFRTQSGDSIPVHLKIGPNAQVRWTAKPIIPIKFGGYALVFDFGKEGRAFGTTLTRVVQPDAGRVFEPSYAVDMPWPDQMSTAVTRTFLKLGVKGCRFGASYVPTTSSNFENSLKTLGEQLNWCKANNITVMLTIGAGEAEMPLGRGRPWLKENDMMMEGNKEDLAWLPKYDPDFQKWTRIVCERYGWPKGPVNAVELWNEPWEGVSISGWGADMLRYREMYRAMAGGVLDARKSGVQVLIGGTSSSSNTRDKLFPDDSNDFLPFLDFVSVHYEGNGGASSLDRRWMSRKGPLGPVRVWDTESWVANSEDRIAGVVASMRSFGQQRAMGTYYGNVSSPYVATLGKERLGVSPTWSPAAAVAAAAKFIGQRTFNRLLFKGGLPWVYVFDDAKNADNGTLVVLGDMTGLYSPRAVLYASAQLGLPRNGGVLSFRKEPTFRMVDFAGNPLSPSGSHFKVPLNVNGYFLRTDGSKGSFARLIAAVEKAQIQGYPPVVLQAKDFIHRKDSVVRLSIQNILNRDVSGQVVGIVGGRPVQVANVKVPANGSREIAVPVPGLKIGGANLYPTKLTFNAGKDGLAQLSETLHCNVIEERKIKVDGDLSDWEGTLPISITADGIRASVTEESWLPFVKRKQAAGSRLTTAQLAYDAQGFYFAAKISDPTPYSGGVRFGNRNDDDYFYPEVSQTVATSGSGFAVRWQGKVTAKSTGEYRFTTVSDDGVRLWVGDNLVIDNWTDHGAMGDDALVSLTAGAPVDVRMEYFQGGGGAEARLFWQGPADDARTRVPGPFKREVFSDRGLTNLIGGREDAFIDFVLGPDLPGVNASAKTQAMKWPAGVRRFSYRKDPDLPSGNGTDNVQLAFNVLLDKEKYLKMHAPGVMPKYTVYPDTDYEFALNDVHANYGGGGEVFRLLAPGIPRKHFYPRQPKAPMDGGVINDAQYVVRRTPETRTVEAFLPWSCIPDVEKRMREGKTIKFTFRVNDSDGPSYELAQGRSVSKENNLAFHNDWNTHWANEIEFAFQPKAKLAKGVRKP